MSKAAVDVTDSGSEIAATAPSTSGRSATPAGLWSSNAALSAIDGAVVGNTLGFVVGAFPGMCIGAASGGIAGVLGGGLLAPVMKPAARVAADAMPGTFVLTANGAANSMIGKLCAGPRTDLGKGSGKDDVEEQTTDPAVTSGGALARETDGSNRDETFEEIPEEPTGSVDERSPQPRQLPLSRASTDLSSAKGALDAAMVRASAAGAQGAIAGAEVGGAVVGTALALPGAVLGSLVGGVMGMCVDVHGRYFSEAWDSPPPGKEVVVSDKQGPAPATA